MWCSGAIRPWFDTGGLLWSHLYRNCIVFVLCWFVFVSYLYCICRRSRFDTGAVMAGVWQASGQWWHKALCKYHHISIIILYHHHHIVLSSSYCVIIIIISSSSYSIISSYYIIVRLLSASLWDDVEKHLIDICSWIIIFFGETVQLGLPHRLILPYCLHHLLLSWYLHQPGSYQKSL